MKQGYILVIDTGSSSMRGLLFNPAGTIIYKYQIPYFMEITTDSAAEQDCSVYKSCLLEITGEAARKCAENGWQLGALAFTSQRSSVLALDKNGTALYNILMWYDKRPAKLCNAISEEEKESIYRICGLRTTPVLSAPKMLWMKQNLPDVYNAAYKLVSIHDYLLYLSTGNFVTDTSLASRTCLLDIRTGRWSDPLLNLWGINPEKLCTLISPGDIAGYVTPDFEALTGIPSGLPVISSGGDQQCSLLGQSAVDAGDIAITSGTASYVSMLTQSAYFDKGMRLNLSVSVLPGKYVLEASSMSSGAIYSWIKQTLYPEGTAFSQMNEEVLTSPAGAAGLIMLPDLAGKGCPQWDTDARGSFHNIGFHHRRADFARAALEGICSEIGECFHTLRECCQTSGSVSSAGGLTGFFAFNQMLADMMETSITLCSTEETTGVGAWAVAAVAIGLYENAPAALNAIKNPEPEPSSVFTPDINTVLLYRRQEEIRHYLRLHSYSSSLFKPLNRLP